MKSPLPWILLAISLAGNLFFIGGYLYGGRLVTGLEASPGTRLERLADRLELDAGQRRELHEASRALVSRAAEFSRSSRQQLQGFWRELARPEPDRQRLERQLQGLGKQELDYRRAVAIRIAGFMKHLQQKQRDELSRLLARRNLFRYLGNQAARQPRAGASR